MRYEINGAILALILNDCAKKKLLELDLMRFTKLWHKSSQNRRTFSLFNITFTNSSSEIYDQKLIVNS